MYFGGEAKSSLPFVYVPYGKGKESMAEELSRLIF